ncbi:LPP20 family lipoprotein [Helicobacter sp. 13S00477-4]|uniref:LPP20 family lipoprotein n=1 Tax=Helicobacter sp. 13S00477-4 TaxID=1905759 RepID=UPI000BA5D6ED|nr:LPP20 family lipoprotein [Helicobacter sp. 13S00477-4]PAF52680.1 hypothetical protein BKH44_00400 [Helicobacter sp. 13S00477-4]
MNIFFKPNLLKKLIFLIACFFLGACANHLSISNPPGWFLAIPNNHNNLYGNGIGKTLQEAKQNAINDLALNIKIKINSDTDIQNTQINNKQSSEILQNIQISLDTIELQNITIIRNEYKNKNYYVQIKIPKNTLLQNLKNKYDLSYERLKYFLKNTCSSIFISDKNTLESSLQYLFSLKESIYTLDPTTKLQSLNVYENILNQNSPLPKVKLIFEPQDKKEIINTLSAEYAKFIQNSDKKNIYTIKNKILIQNKTNQYHITLQVDMYDCKDNIISHIELDSTQNTKIHAMNRIKVKLYKKLKEYSQSQNNQDF